MKSGISAALCASVSLLVFPVAAAAQDQKPAAADQTAEIVVTANRVETSAQKTPVALTVYSGADLAAKGVSSINALAAVDPSVNITSSTGAAYVAVRGIASTDTTETGDPSVPIARDNFFTNRSFSIGTSMYDIARVEVLKGPQGTLFGRNSTGGLIQIITRKPGKELGANMSVEVGNYNAVKTEVGVDLPISDRVQLRVAGFQSYHEGYRVLDGIGGRGDDDNTKSGRITLAFQPTDKLSGLIQYQHDDINTTGDVAMKRPYQTAAFSDPSHFANYATSYNRLQGDRIRWEFNYALPAGLSLTYAGGYDHQKFRHSTDASAADANGNLVGGATNFIQEENPSTWNHEVRLASDQSKRLTAQVGYFHFDEHNSNLNSGLIERSGPYNGQYLVHFLYDVKTKSDGVFGQLGFRLTDTVHLSGGARYTWDKKERTGASYLNCTITGFPAFLCNSDGFYVTPSNGNISEGKPTFHIGVDWTPTARNMFYAKFDTGFKSGGFNSNGSGPSVNYGPETLKAWEVGTKNRFLGGHLTANADAFYQTYNGYQASQQTAVIAGSAAGVFNIGSAEIYGVEAQFAAQTSTGLRADVSGTYLHTRFTDATPIVKGDGETVVNVVGNQLPNAPKLVITAGLEQKIPVGHVSFTPRIEWKHSSSYYFSAFNDPDTRQGEYDTFNASLKFQPAAQNVEIMLFVRNLTNQTVFAGMQENFNTTPYTNAYQFAPPRTYGVRASAKF